MTGPELRARRNALGLTQKQLGAQLGCHQVEIARWETGAVPITPIRAAWLEAGLRPLEAVQRR